MDEYVERLGDAGCAKIFSVSVCSAQHVHLLLEAREGDEDLQLVIDTPKRMAELVLALAAAAHDAGWYMEVPREMDALRTRAKEPARH